jgi:hypothetical protein
MKKLLLSFLLIAGLGFAANAQKEGAVNKISIGAEFVYPIGVFADSYKIGYGGSAMGEYNILKNLNLTASVGYTSLTYIKELKDAYSNIGLPTSNAVYYPAKLGVKYYYKKLYGAAEIGGAMSNIKERATVLAYSGGVGASFSVSPKSSVDFGVRYEEWNLNGRFPFVGLRAAYAFGL